MIYIAVSLQHVRAEATLPYIDINDYSSMHESRMHINNRDTVLIMTCTTMFSKSLMRKQAPLTELLRCCINHSQRSISNLLICHSLVLARLHGGWGKTPHNIR